jgi:hypothetical protein
VVFRSRVQTLLLFFPDLAVKTHVSELQTIAFLAVLRVSVRPVLVLRVLVLRVSVLVVS